MKLHLPLSLRKSLIALFSVTLGITCIPTNAGVMHSDATIATYVDFGQNKGRYVIGNAVNDLLQHIRTTEGGIGIEYTDGTQTYYISNEQGMIDFSGVHDGGHSTLVGQNMLASVLHNGSLNASFCQDDLGNEHALNYSVLDIRGSDTFRLAPDDGNGSSYDYMLQRQTRIVTDVVSAPVSTVDINTLPGQHMYHAGAGIMGMYNEDTDSIKNLAWAYAFVIGDIDQITGISIYGETDNHSIYKEVGYGNGIGASLENPLPNATRGGDSGSPVFIYNTATGQYEYAAAHQSGNGRSWGQARGNLKWTHETLDAFSVQVDMGSSNEVHIGAVNTRGATITDNKGNSGTIYTGTITTGGKSLSFKGVQSGQYTWRDMSDLKDTQTWYAYDAGRYDATNNADGKLNQSVTDLFYTENIVLNPTQKQNTIVLDATVDMGAGYMEFRKGTLDSAAFTITGEGTQLHTAGYVVNDGVEVHLKLTNPADYMTEWRKTGAGDFYIDGTGNTNALLNVGGSGRTFLQQTGGYAAYNVLANTNAYVCIDNVSQIKRDFTFGAGGGTLDMNGNTMNWYTTTTGDDHFTINALTDEAMITNGATTGATLFYKEGGDTVYKGSFSDSASGSLCVDYQGNGTWTLHSIHTDLSHHADSGLTVSNGTVILVGTNTIHGAGSESGLNANRYHNENDWHYADATMDVTVCDGATFELGSHARLTGDVTVNTGGTFLMKEGVRYEQEYIEGGSKLQDTSLFSKFYGLKGNVNLASGADMLIKYSEGVTAGTTYGHNISGEGNVAIDLGGGDKRFVLSGNNSFSGTKTLLSGGLIATSNAALGNTGTNRWKIAKDAWLASHGFTDDSEILSYIDPSSEGTLALSNDLTQQLNLNTHKSLYLGAEQGRTVQYGAAGTTMELAATNGAWHLGGGGGDLIVNFRLTGENNLLLGASANSIGSVYLANTGNTFSGNIIFAGEGVTLDYAPGALGQSKATLSYGNGMALNQGADIARMDALSDGMALLNKAGSEAVVLSGHSTLVLGASMDTVYSGNLTLAEGQDYRFGAMNGASLTIATELDSAHNILVDGQGTTGGTVILAGNTALASNLTVMGSRDTAAAGDITLAIGQDVNATGRISLNKGGSLDVAGHQLTVSQGIAGSGVVIDSTGTGTLVFDTSNGAISTSAAMNLDTICKVGTEDLNISGTHAFGTLEVEEGALVLNGDLTAAADSQIRLGAGTTLDLQNYQASVGISMEENAGTASLAVQSGTTATLKNGISLGKGTQLNLTGANSVYSLSGTSYGGEDATLSLQAMELQFSTNNAVEILGTLDVQNNATIYSNGTATDMERNISELKVSNNSKVTLDERTWSTVWNLGKLTGEGELHWNSNTTHSTTSRLILSGEGDFSGSISMNRQFENESRTHGAFIELAHNKAAQNASISLTGKSANAVASLAINTDNAYIKGLEGNSHSYVYAGESLVDAPMSGTARPSATRAALLTMDVDTGKSYTYAGMLGSSADSLTQGLSLVKTGAGTQIFTGNVSVNDIRVQGGQLQIDADKLTMRGNVSMGYGAGLSMGDYTLANGKTFQILSGAEDAARQAYFSGTLNLAGGTLSFSGDAMQNALNHGTAVLGMGALNYQPNSTQAIHFENTTKLTQGSTYTLASGNWSGINSFTTTGLNYYNAVFSSDANGLHVTLDLQDGCQIWDGTESAGSWDASTFGRQASILGNNSTAVFDSSASGRNILVSSNVTVGSAVFNSAEEYNVSAMGGTASVESLLIQGGGNVTIENGMTVSGKTTIEEGQLIIKDTNTLKGTVSGNGTLVLDWGAGNTGTPTLSGLDTLHLVSGTYGHINAPLQNVDNIIVEAGATYVQGVSAEYNGNITFKGGTLSLLGGSISGNLSLEGDITLFVQSYGLDVKAEVKSQFVGNGHTITQNSDSTSGVIRFGGASSGVLENYVVKKGILQFDSKSHSGHGTLSVESQGKLRVAGGSLSAEKVNLNHGMLEMKANTTLMTDIKVNNAGSIAIEGSDSSIKGSISGHGTLTMASSANSNSIVQSTILDGDDGALALNHTGGTISLTAANSHSGGTTINGGMLITRNSQALGTGSVTVNDGTLLLDITGMGALGSISELVLNGGMVDATAAGYTADSCLALGGTITASGGYIDLGNNFTSTGTTYTIFDLTTEGLVLDNLSSLKSHILVNGNTLSAYTGADFRQDGNTVTLSFSNFELANYVWNGGTSATIWDKEAALWDVTPDIPNDNIAFSNGTNVVFASDADVTVADGVSVYNLDIKDNVNLVTRGKVDIQGSLTVGNNVSWDYSGDMHLSFAEGDMSKFKALNVGNGASLTISSTSTSNTAAANLGQVTGTGDVILKFSDSNNGKGVNLANFAGDVTLKSGKLLADTTTLNEASTLKMASNSMLIFNGSNVEISNNIDLNGTSTFCVNSGKSGIISGCISGSSILYKDGTGSLTFTQQNTHSGLLQIDYGSIVLDMEDGGTYKLNNRVSGWYGSLVVADGTTLDNNGKNVGATLDLRSGSTAIFTRAEQITYKANVNAGATLSIQQEFSGTASVNYVYGSGLLNLNMSAAEGNRLAVSSTFGGTTHIQCGSFTLNNSSFGNALSLGEGTAMYLSSGSSYTLNKGLTLTGTSQIHQKDGAALTISSDLAGNGTYDRRGSGSLSITGDVNLAGFSQNIDEGSSTLSGATSLGKLTLNGGELHITGSANLGSIEQTAGTLTINGSTTKNAQNIGDITIAGGELNIGGNNSSQLDGNITVSDGGTLRFTGAGSDVLDYTKGKAIVVDGGTVDFGSTRQTIQGWDITLKNGAKLSGTGGNYNATHTAALDLNEDSTIIVAEGQNTIAANIRLRGGNSRTLTYSVAEGASVEVSGRMHADNNLALGNVMKTGKGTLDISSRTMLDKLSLGQGETKLSYTGEDGNTINTLELAVNARLSLADSVTLNATGGITVGQSSELSLGDGVIVNGNVSLQSGATLNMDSVVTLNGELSLGEGLILGGESYTQVMNLKQGETLVLFQGLDSVSVASLLQRGGAVTLASGDMVKASDYFTNIGNGDLMLAYTEEEAGNGTLSIAAVPEPATATLSLLALAALAARRRRA